MNYVSYYDEDGKNCEMDIGLDMFWTGLQCTPSVATYFANNTIQCDVHRIIISRLASVGTCDNNDSINRNGTKTLGDKVGSLTKRCKPICERWQYESIVGYSELTDSQGRTSDANGNISWSRITVSIPSAYYEEHVEEEPSGVYVIFCNVGGAMGVCLGLSAVTLVQLVAFGLHSCCVVWRYTKR